MPSKLTMLKQISLIKFMHYNFLCKNVVKDKGTYLIPYKGTRIDIHEGAKIVLHKNLYICANKVKGSKEEAYLLLYENAFLEVNGPVTLNYGAMLQAHKGAHLRIGMCHINTRATIIADKEIIIGNEVLISRDVTIFDSDFHPVLNEDGKRTNEPSSVIIEDHVWIGVKATVLRGVHVGKGAVIGANALVSANVPEKALISAIPARAFGYIEWRT